MLGCPNFGFGRNFIKWINTIYKEPTFCIKNISSELTMQRGYIKDVPISALLFILAVEILSVKIKQAENIDAIRVFDDISNLIHYTDDTTSTLADKQLIYNICYEAVE